LVLQRYNNVNNDDNDGNYKDDDDSEDVDVNNDNNLIMAIWWWRWDKNNAMTKLGWQWRPASGREAPEPTPPFQGNNQFMSQLWEEEKKE
jgi:hypothetical protein